MKALKEKGNCECCTDSIDVVLYELHSTKMCKACYEADSDATAKAVEANSFVQSSREIDATIEIKVDVFNATTTSAQELMMSIIADETIPTADKNYVMAQESLKRFKHLQQVIFEERAAFLESIRAKENAMRAWQVQIHTFAAKVEGQRKETFKNFDVSYQPTKPKSMKPTKSAPASTHKRPTKVELFDASKKYDIPMAAISMQAAAFNMTADEAGRSIAANRTRNAQSVESVPSTETTK